MASSGFREVDTGEFRAYMLSLTCDTCVDSRLTAAANTLLPVLEALANSSIPSSLDQNGAWTDIGDGFAIMYDVSRSAFHLSLEGITLTASVRAAYAVTVGYRMDKPWPFSGSVVVSLASCGNDDARLVDVAMSTTVWVGTDGIVRSNSRVENVSFPNSCLISLANINVTPVIEPAVTRWLGEAASRFDGHVREAKIRIPVSVP
jgi:hypothetical protein